MRCDIFTAMTLKVTPFFGGDAV